MIKRYMCGIAPGDMREAENGEWVRFEDVQQACIESYNYGVADTQDAMQRALGIKHD